MELTNKEILCILYTAKAKFIADRNASKFNRGMCFYIQICINFIFNEHIYYSKIKDIIPEFIPETFGLNVLRCQFWWDIYDVQSRINAFDKLINHYENLIKEL